MTVFIGIEDNNTELYMETHTQTQKILNSHNHSTKKVLAVLEYLISSHAP